VLISALGLSLSGCAAGGGEPALGFILPWSRPAPVVAPAPVQQETCALEAAVAEREQAEAFRRAETERAEQLAREIERLQADLRTAESALVEVESGLASNSSRADAVSSLAVTRIQVERAASRAPWRADEIAVAHEKLDEAERQVAESRFGAALFFVYRARRVAESVLQEAEQVLAAGNARVVRARRVNLRAGPSMEQRVLAVLDAGMPVIPQTVEGDWTLVQVSGGPTGWIHRSLLGSRLAEGPTGVPAAPQP
jgi:hypothetical protein